MNEEERLKNASLETRTESMRVNKEFSDFEDNVDELSVPQETVKQRANQVKN